MSEYPRFAFYTLTEGEPPFQWHTQGSVFLRSEEERQFLISQGYEFPHWERDGIASKAILAEQS